MQTFLPYPSFIESAKALDWRRLGKQRVETKQILEALQRGGGAWYNHPATQMWKGHEPMLCLYGMEICTEWIRRGYKDTLYRYFDFQLSGYEILLDQGPEWLGDQRIHSSHRGRLLAKDPIWYSQWGWDDQPVEKVIYARDLS